jgi:nitrogen PTS system EIIA component
VPRDDLLALLLSREAAGSTDLGDGIALPHPRYPLVQSGVRPAVALCYLEKPVPWKEGRPPVHTLFAAICPTPRAHLRLQARLVYALREPNFRAAVQRKAPAAEIVAEAGRLEDALAAARTAVPETS